jgi:hypothetical protein
MNDASSGRAWVVGNRRDQCLCLLVGQVMADELTA